MPDVSKCLTRAVHFDGWKPVRQGKDSALEIYNLGEDLAESHNVAAQHTEVASQAERYLGEAHSI